MPDAHVSECRYRAQLRLKSGIAHTVQLSNNARRPGPARASLVVVASRIRVALVLRGDIASLLVCGMSGKSRFVMKPLAGRAALAFALVRVRIKKVEKVLGEPLGVPRCGTILPVGR